MLLQSLLTKLAAAGLATKAAAGGAALVVAASAAGAAETLPAPAQDAFDRLVASTEVELEDATEGGNAVTSEQADFGQRVSQDANGETDGEPGVDGAAIACEASEGRSGTCESDAERLEGTDESDRGGFGERVSQDATGESDGEPGVDGDEISDAARTGNGGEGADHAPDNAPDDVRNDDDASGRGGPEGTPGEAAVDTFRPGDEG